VDLAVARFHLARARWELGDHDRDAVTAAAATLESAPAYREVRAEIAAWLAVHPP
jgi:hypothetical protein